MLRAGSSRACHRVHNLSIDSSTLTQPGIVIMQTIMSGRISKHFPHSKSQGTRSTKEAGRSESKLSRAGSGLQASTGDACTGL